jgi:hypothetical protein
LFLGDTAEYFQAKEAQFVGFAEVGILLDGAQSR